MLLLIFGAGIGVASVTDGRGRAGGTDARISLGGLSDALLSRAGGSTASRAGGGAGDGALSGAGGSEAGRAGAGGSDE